MNTILQQLKEQKSAQHRRKHVRFRDFEHSAVSLACLDFILCRPGPYLTNPRHPRTRLLSTIVRFAAARSAVPILVVDLFVIRAETPSRCFHFQAAHTHLIHMSELSDDRSRTHYGFLQLPSSKSFALTVAEGFEQRSESQTPEIHSVNPMPQPELVLQAGLSARDQKLCSILHFLVA